MGKCNIFSWTCIDVNVFAVHGSCRAVRISVVVAGNMYRNGNIYMHTIVCVKRKI